MPSLPTSPATTPREHGGDYAQARLKYGGAASDWLDLSTGINPRPYPVGPLSPAAWTVLPPAQAMRDLCAAAAATYHAPKGATVLPAGGVSALIGVIPSLLPPGTVYIPGPTYNEHAAAFAAHGWRQVDAPDQADVTVIVHPNNPDGHLWADPPRGRHLTIIDESFADVVPSSLMPLASEPGMIVLRSFGKFYGLAGVRLGFAVLSDTGAPALADRLGPWPVSGMAAELGSLALRDTDWAAQTRLRLARDAERLDGLVLSRGARLVGGTTLFRLYEVEEAAAWQAQLARHHVWSRVFSYAPGWLRLGLPDGDARWQQLETALAACP
ncbi:cobalamin biosynthetic protein CobC [Rubricella aquisinus]|uniref:Cobalamin biosynthetic protein CobC n=1 Tax=Rubricella aquisinus TaxID=2028108 RepID=A0A840WIP6_9RHOB|nr:threonine-phosphate decarboxylase [Rubricella aquisinus]MBB5514988.1 cobalamin biosynthetic protein CobC [Rubricella aquisinus]